MILELWGRMIGFVSRSQSFESGAGEGLEPATEPAQAHRDNPIGAPSS